MIGENSTLGLTLATSLAFTVAAAVCSDSVFQIDEYFQIVELASFKLGRTPTEALPWEYAARIRPWLQPGAFVLLARGLDELGVKHPFVQLRLFHVVSGLLSWAAMAALVLAVRRWFPSARWRRVAALSLALPCFVPYLAARVSSESGSSTFLALALAALIAPGAGSIGDGRLNPLRHLAAGLGLGLAFSLRYQTGIAVFGLLSWVFVYEPDRWRKLGLMSVGLAVPLGAGLAIDAWGYGVLEVVPWNYLRENLIAGHASRFGTMPFFAYLGLLAALFPPFGLALLGGLLLFWWKWPRHLLTWITLPFFAAHSLIGHKEIRFLFPILPAATLCLVLLLATEAPARRWEARAVRALKVLWLSRVTWALDAVALVVLCCLPSTDNLELNRFFFDHAHDAVSWVALSDPRRLHGTQVRFVWPSPVPPIEQVRSASELKERLDSASGPVLVTAKHPLPQGTEALLEERGARVFSSLPPWVVRLNAFHWADRADVTFVWSVSADRRPSHSGAAAQ